MKKEEKMEEEFWYRMASVIQLQLSFFFPLQLPLFFLLLERKEESHEGA
jgi:hypothetical protein